MDARKSLLIVNGQVVGDLPPSPLPWTDHAGRTVETEDVLQLAVVCLEVMQGDEKVGRAVVAVTTKSGAPDFMRSHLEELAALQEEYRGKWGRYARTLEELDFFTTHAPLPIRLTADDAGWTASVELAPVPTTCSAGADAQSEGWVSCVDT